MFRRIKKDAASDTAKPPRIWLGILCVLLISLPFGALTGLLAVFGWFAGLPCLFCVLLSYLAFEKIVRAPGSQAGLWIAALIGLLICLAGLYVSYVIVLYRADLVYGYTLEQAVGLLPSALWDPEKLPYAASNHLSLLIGVILSLFIGTYIRYHTVLQD